MKEIVKASVAGIGFVFDKDAFEVLESYLGKLSDIYRTNPDGDEIVADIEARIVELILSHQNTEAVVSKELVEEVTSQLGTPEETETLQTPHEEAPAEVFPRRLYRDRNGAKLGGVCNGLGKYFDTDPVIFRVGIFLPLLMLIILPTLGLRGGALGFLGSLFGSFCLLYVILWIAIPAAKTPRQKLEMQGRRITASDIEREMSAATARQSYAQPSESVFARLFSLLGRVLLFIVKLFVLLLGFAFAVTALGLIVGIIGLMLGKSWVLNGLETPDVSLMLGSMGISVAGFSALVLALIAIPLVMLVYQMIRLTFGGRNNSVLMWILGGGWILLAVFTTITVVANSEELFRSGRGFRIEYSDHDISVDTEEGWEIYERNVQLYRESLEKARTEAETAGIDAVATPEDSPQIENE